MHDAFAIEDHDVLFKPAFSNSFEYSSAGGTCSENDNFSTGEFFFPRLWMHS